MTDVVKFITNILPGTGSNTRNDSIFWFLYAYAEQLPFLKFNHDEEQDYDYD